MQVANRVPKDQTVFPRRPIRRVLGWFWPQLGTAKPHTQAAAATQLTVEQKPH